jgi:pimeloyl-ACP methyl ester carboxylesterase
MVNINGYETHYEIDDFSDPWAPESVPILIQHGNIRSGLFWRHWVPRLSRTRPVIRRDLIGHGRSEDPGPDYEWSMDVLTNDLASFLDALEVPEVHYVGDSFGGILGSAFAARFPSRVKTLSLCATPPRSPENEAVRGDGDRVVSKINELGAAGWIELLLQNEVLCADGPRHTEWVRREAGRTPTHVVAGIIELLSPSDGSDPVDVMPLLATLPMPVLIIAPTRGPVVSLAEQVAMRDVTPDAEIAVIPAPGHEVYVTGADLCIDALLDFLRRRGGGPTGETETQVRSLS